MSSDRPLKKPRLASSSSSSTLDSFILNAPPLPNPSFTTPSVNDRGSTFKASVYAAKTSSEVTRILSHAKDTSHEGNDGGTENERVADHCMAAWRFLVPKKGKNGAGGEADWEVQRGRWRTARGKTVLKAMETQGVLDAVVIVSRWFGGTMLGPVRFQHITTVAADACKTFVRLDALNDLIARLVLLDAQITSLRTKLTSLSASSLAPAPTPPTAEGSTTAPKPGPAYKELCDQPDNKKAERLVVAREKQVKSLEALVHKRMQAATPAERDSGGGGFVLAAGEEATGDGT